MTIEMVDRTQSTPKGIVENLLIKIDKFIFTVDFVILDMVEDFQIPIILVRPLLAIAHAKDEIDYSKLDQGKPYEIEAKEEPNEEREIDFSSLANLKEHWCKAILQQKRDEYEFLASCDPYNDQCNGDNLLDNSEDKCYWCCLNDDKRIDVAWEGLSLNNWIRVRYGKDDMTNMNVVLEMSSNTGEDREDLENFGDAKMELILNNVFDKLDDEWFSGTVIDEEDLDGIVYYLELKSYDGFIDVNDEAYKKKRCELLGMTYETPTPILIKKVEITRYTIGLGESYTKGRILQIDELPRTSTNVVAIRAELMKEMDIGGSVQRET
ncbi:hypothetical protein Tco_0353484 [Tanacetum coccineum]